MNKLQVLRMQRGLSQAQLGKMLGIDPSTLSRCERGWFAKAPSGLEEKLRQFFGPEWTFTRLMEPVPDLTAGNSTAV